VRPLVALSTQSAIASSARTVSASASALRRSMRSIRMPAGIAQNSHGSSAMAAIPLISSGSSVSLAASNGMAVRAMPSPRLLAMLAVKRFVKAGPSPRFGTGVGARC
jgi:hypothetical protein